MNRSIAFVLTGTAVLTGCGKREVFLADIAATGEANLRVEHTPPTAPPLLCFIGSCSGSPGGDRVRIGPEHDELVIPEECLELENRFTATFDDHRSPRELLVELSFCDNLSVDMRGIVTDPFGTGVLEISDGIETWEIEGLFKPYTLEAEAPFSYGDTEAIPQREDIVFAIEPAPHALTVDARFSAIGRQTITLDTITVADGVHVAVEKAREGEGTIYVDATPILPADRCLGPSSCLGLPASDDVRVDVQAD